MPLGITNKYSYMEKIKSFLESKTFVVVLSFVGLYLLSAGASWAIFTYLNDSPNTNYSGSGIDDVRSKIAELPKTEECPINGALFSEPERAIWEKRRPILAVIENHEESRPLEGLDRADIVYEAIAEGGVTRQLGVFYCGVAADNFRLAPIRSARIHFVSWAAEYGDYPLFVHVGGANNICNACPGGIKYKGKVAPEVRAIEKLGDLDWRKARGNDFDTTYDSGFPTFFRDPERLGRPIATGHTMVATTDEIYKQASDRGYEYEDNDGDAWDKSFEMWQFADESPATSPEGTEVSFDFWEGYPNYSVVWKYDSETNSYLRENGGEPVRDLNSDVQTSSKNVVVQFIDQRGPVDEELHIFYKTVSEGDAIFFMNGVVIEGTWEKESFTGRTIFYDKDGEEITFVRGVVWIEGVPTGNEIIY